MINWEAVWRKRFSAGLSTARGASRKAHATTCRDCHAPCITGLDGDRLAFTALCDPWPVDSAGELAALLAGRRTWSLRWAGVRYELDPRTAIEIAATHPDAIEVLAEHACGRPLPARAVPARRATRFAGAVETFSIDPPF
jgi:hypothetical protein